MRMTKGNDKEALENYVNDRYSRSDYRRVVRRFSQDDDVELKDDMRDHWDKLPEKQPLSTYLTGLFTSLKFRIIPDQYHRTTVSSFYQKAAAILFIPLLLGTLYLFWHLLPEQNEAMASIHSPLGARTAFVLPDGTTGWLNSGSELSYPVNFDERNVVLNGQAYFDVVKQKNNKFKVKASHIAVVVYGTSFDISAYKNEPEIDVVLLEGEIRVQGHDGNGAVIMEPNQRLNIKKAEKKATISLVDAASQISWTQGILQFNGEPLQEVMRKLGRWYNVDFEIKDDQLKRYNFKATFKEEPLEEILRMMALTTPMRYEFQERKLNENGVYMKRKIIID